MSTNTPWRSLGSRATGKWQVPLLAVSLILLGISVFRLGPPPHQLSFAEAIGHLDQLIAEHRLVEAIRFGEKLLAPEKHSSREQSEVRLRMGRALAQWSRNRMPSSIDLAPRITDHFRQALQNDLELTASDQLDIAEAYDQQRQFKNAVTHYELALELSHPDSLNLRRRILEIHLRELDSPPPIMEELLREFLALVPADQEDLRLWAIELEIEVLEQMGRIGEAQPLLAQHINFFRSRELEGRYQYLEAFLLYKSSRFDESERLLRSLRNSLDSSQELHARSGWLLGRTILDGGGPARAEEAASFFLNVVHYFPRGIWATAARLGNAEALALNDRHDEALAYYRFAVDDLPSLENHGPVDVPVLRTSLAILAEKHRHEGNLGAAIAYGRLALRLVDSEDDHRVALLQQIADSQLLYAEQVVNQTEARAVLESAAADLLELSRLYVDDADRSSGALWQAAELQARIGEWSRGVELFETLIVERPQDWRVPSAYLRLGQLRRVLGDFPAAIETFRECYRRFPRTLEGARALIPLAECYLGMGGEHVELGEKTLGILLEESEVIRPEAPEFAEALFLLAGAHWRKGDFEKTVAVLEEVLTRYPKDRRVERAHLELADAYRQSGLGIKADLVQAKFTGERESRIVEMTRRLEQAAQLYQGVIEEFEVREAETLDKLERRFLDDARFYRAACFFELQNYPYALKLYEEAAASMTEEPQVLAAYVQMIHCHVFLGQPREARGALTRAMALANSLADEAFAGPIAVANRQDWKHYLEWLDQSQLF